LPAPEAPRMATTLGGAKSLKSRSLSSPTAVGPPRPKKMPASSAWRGSRPRLAPSGLRQGRWGAIHDGRAEPGASRAAPSRHRRLDCVRAAHLRPVREEHADAHSADSRRVSGSSQGTVRSAA
jgi:hypothetical protein